MTYAPRIAALTVAIVAVTAAMLVVLTTDRTPAVDAGLPATLTVNTPNDHLGHQPDDVLSLREAVLLATGDLPIFDLTAAECAQVVPSSFPDGCETPYLLGAPYANTIHFDPTVFPQIDPPSIFPVATYELDTFGTTLDATAAFVTIEGDSSFPCFLIDADSNQLRNLTITGCRDAIEIADGDQNVIAENTLVVNTRHGVFISEHSSTNTLEDNQIGTNTVGGSLGNGFSGVFIDNSHGNTLARNRIAFNGTTIVNTLGSDQVDDNGVTITQGVGNDLEANEFHANAGLAIDLAADGVSENDPSDPDAGPNRLQNFPVITAAIAQSPFRVAGTLDSTPGLSHRLDFFENPTCDPSGNGEGNRFLGSAEIVTHQGPSDFLEFVDPAVQPGNFVTATATNLLTNDTSEFSACVVITAPGATPTPIATPTPTPILTPTDTPTPGRLHGDIDCDGNINAIDVLKLLAFLVGDPFPQPPGCPPIAEIADIDCDGDVDAVDALQILRNLAGLPVNQNPGCPAIGDPV